jgi:hypothetical protein
MMDTDADADAEAERDEPKVAMNDGLLGSHEIARIELARADWFQLAAMWL